MGGNSNCLMIFMRIEEFCVWQKGMSVIGGDFCDLSLIIIMMMILIMALGKFEAFLSL